MHEDVKHEAIESRMKPPYAPFTSMHTFIFIHEKKERDRNNENGKNVSFILQRPSIHSLPWAGFHTFPLCIIIFIQCASAYVRIFIKEIIITEVTGFETANFSNIRFTTRSLQQKLHLYAVVFVGSFWEKKNNFQKRSRRREDIILKIGIENAAFCIFKTRHFYEVKKKCMYEGICSLWKDSKCSWE